MYGKYSILLGNKQERSRRFLVLDVPRIYYGMNAISDLFDLTHTAAREFLARFTYPFEALGGLGGFLTELGPRLGDGFMRRGEGYVHRTAKIAPTAELCGPCIICANAEVRHCAYVRGNVLVGEGCVVGNSTELKNCILFDGVQVPHFNYVGDSILGYRAHLGAGVICANVRLDRGEIFVRGEEKMSTGRKKVGAFVGDGAEVGCNSVLAPGAVVRRGARILPLSFVKGTVG